MIFWINGAFGSGKTTIAEKMNEKLSNSVIYDPEIIGGALTELVPKIMKVEDYQDYKEWRKWNTQLLKKINEEFSGTIIVPMTIYNKDYIDEIFRELIKNGIEIKHILLDVSKDEILRRLKKRDDGTLEWGKSKVDDILEAYSTLEFTEVVSYNTKDVSSIVDQILINHF